MGPSSWLAYCGTRLLMLLVSMIFFLVLIEIGLRVLEPKTNAPPITTDIDASIHAPEDPMLGKRTEPNAIGHDAWGYRNPEVPEQAEIVVLGDSHTWSFGVAMEEAWPLQLVGLLDQTVYNMGQNAYGIVHYWAQVPEALRLKPDTVIVAFYDGNDLWDAYYLVYGQDYYQSWRDPEQEAFLSSQLNRQTDLDSRIAFTDEYSRRGIPGWFRDLSEHSLLAQKLLMIAIILNSKDVDMDREWLNAHPDEGLYFESENISALLTTTYRLNGLDRRNPRIREGYRLTEMVFPMINQQVTEAGARLIVVLIPTREFVYAEAVEAQQGELISSYQALVEQETVLRNDLMALLEQNGILYVDMLPAFHEAIASQERIYPDATDAHPNVAGYRLIAETVAQFLREHPIQ